VSPDTPEQEAAFNQEQTMAKQAPLQLPKLTRPVNILVLGTKVLSSDLGQSPEEVGGYHARVNSFKGLTDTMLLMRFNPSTDDLSILSIPRDTRVDLPGHGRVKINTANQRGGATLSAEAISDLLADVPIDRYVRVNVQGVEKLIDALGGVEFYVPKDMKYRDDSQHLYIDIEKGKQRLDGETAVNFMLFRHDEYGDIGRVQRQQLLIRAVIEQALHPGTLARVPSIFSVIQSNVDTNLSVEELLALAGFAAQREQKNIEMLMLPGRFGNVEVAGHNGTISYWLPNDRQIDQMMARNFDVGQTSPPEEEEVSPYIRIAIQDSTDRPQAVQSVNEVLQEEGFRNIYVASDWGEPLSQTRIVAQNGNIQAAEAVANALGVGQVFVESTGALDSTVSIQLGEDWLGQQVLREESTN
jgi:LCP family protein required for cell wall assembly